MSRSHPRPAPDHHRVLRTLREDCPVCGGHLRRDYDNFRTLVTLQGSVRLRLCVRRCRNPACGRYHVPYRPEEEGSLALAGVEFGFDVVALVGVLRHREHRSVPEIHLRLVELGVAISQRSVTNLVDLYDELVAVSLSDNRRLGDLLGVQGRVILAIDGLQPHKGHEVLWVVRDCLSGEVLLARTLLSATTGDLAALLGEVKKGLEAKPGVAVPVAAVISDGQQTIRKAVAQVFPGVAHQLCQFHYLREAARPAFEADRAAKKQLKKRVRGVRAVERSVESKPGEAAEVVREYCAAVRSALDDDGPPPLDPPGLKLHDRLEAISKSLSEVEKKGACCRGNSGKSRR